MFRRKLGRKEAKRNFRKGARVKKKNFAPLVRRGGIRL